MSDLKYDLHKNDFLMDKVSKIMYFVVAIDLHNVIIREEKDGDDVSVKRMPKHMVNLSMIKVKPDVMKVLYGDKQGNVTPDDIPDTTPSKSSE